MNGTDVEKKVIEYVTLHYLAVHKWLGETDTDWHAAKYFQVGQSAAKEGHVILGSSLTVKERLRNIQKNLAAKYNRVIFK